jgi:hypothetical protein
MKHIIGYLLSGILLIVFLRTNFLQPRWDYIILHHSATKLGSVRIFRNGHQERGGAWPLNDPMLYHLVIGNGKGAKNGELQMGKRWQRQQLGGGCSSHKGLAKVKNYRDLIRAYSDYFNFTGIHICLVGDFEEDEPTSSQLTTLLSAVSILSDRYNIPPRSILGHKEAQFAPTDCPGKKFPLDLVRKHAAQNPTSHPAQGNVRVLTWKIRLINFWPVLGIFLGEFYYSLFLIFIDACLAYLFLKIAWPLLRSRGSHKPPPISSHVENALNEFNK